MSDKEKTENEPFSWKAEIISWIQIIVAAVAIAFVLNNFVIANSRVPTGSMIPTIMAPAFPTSTAIPSAATW